MEGLIEEEKDRRQERWTRKEKGKETGEKTCQSKERASEQLALKISVFS